MKGTFFNKNYFLVLGNNIRNVQAQNILMYLQEVRFCLEEWRDTSEKFRFFLYN